MTDRIASEDIVEVNDRGQSVVIVAKGQPIPDGVDVPKAKTEPAAKQVAAPAENKARSGPRAKSK